MQSINQNLGVNSTLMNSVSFTPKTYNFRDVEHLQKKLKKYNVDPVNWVGGVKVEVLFNEWKKGECTFERDLEGLIRRAKVVCVSCFHVNQNGEKFRLNEEKQIMPDGSTRRRGYKFVSETMKPNENIEAAAKRALKEELQINDPGLQFERDSRFDENKIKQSTTYTGLRCHYLIYHFKTDIPERLFNERYEEIEDNVKTIFGWEKMS